MNKNIVYIFLTLLNLIKEEKKRTKECMIRSIDNNNYKIDYEILFDVGDSIKKYQPPGCLDGLGARKLNKNKIRIYCNHEINKNFGSQYSVNKGTKLKGARISYFDITIKNKNIRITNAGLAYKEIIFVDNKVRNLSRFCSASYYNQGEFGLIDDIYFTGEEVPNYGSAFALDVKNNKLYEIEALGKHSFENIVLMDIGLKLNKYTCCLIGDDNFYNNQPLFLYIGKKEGTDFLGRNGLKNGKMYHWCSNKNIIGNGYFSPITDGKEPYRFSRPEDININPNKKNVAVFNATGRNRNKGIIYIITIDKIEEIPNEITCKIEILHDCNIENTIKRPDNVMWTIHNDIYIQEDNGNHSSIWKISENDKKKPISKGNKMIEEIITINENHTNFNKSWETCGIIDITNLINQNNNTEYFLTTVQANSNLLSSFTHVKSGQLILIKKTKKNF